MYSLWDIFPATAIAIAYVATARIGFSIGTVENFAALIWAPAGIGLAVALLSRRFLPVVFACALVLSYLKGASPIVALLIAGGNIAESLIGYYFLTTIVRFDVLFSRLTDVFGFILFGSMLPSMVAATVGSAVLAVSESIPVNSFGSVWLAWWVGDMSGIIVVAPVILMWFGRWARYPGHERRSWVLAEYLAFMAVFAFTMAFVFIDSLHPLLRRGPLASLIFLPHIWAAVRFGRRHTVTATFVSSVITVYATIRGLGPFASTVQPLLQQLYFLQFFEIVMAVIVLLIAVVVSQRAYAEDQVAGLNATLVEAQSLADTGSWEYELETKSLHWSEVLYRIHGKEATGRPLIKSVFSEQVHPEDKAMVISVMDAALERLEPIEVSYRIVKPDGSIRYLHAIAKPIHGRWGTIDKVIGVSKDVTEAHVAQLSVDEKTKELEAAVQTIQKSDSAKTDFIAVLAHELRNPLAPIVSTVELLKLGENVDVREHVDVIERQITTMRVLLDDLLDLARISRNKVSLAKRTADLNLVVNHAIQTAMPYIRSRNHVLSYVPGTAAICTLVDPVRVEQVIVNLLNNAAKYTDPGGTITVTVAQEGETVAIAITDTGIGILASDMQSIFEPFSQLEKDEKTLRSGIGVGLHLVKELVVMHGGEVRVTSPGINQGSTFTVYLPMISDAQKSSSPKPSVLETSSTIRQDIKVLIVDDNESASEALRKLLSHMGYEVRAVHSGAVALSVLQEYEPTVMLLDIGMSDMDGYELARRIRGIPAFKKTGLIALTGYGQDDDRERSRAAGFDRHLVKPVSGAVICENIDALSKKVRA